jgi:replication-associated recombination protein RarA
VFAMRRRMGLPVPDMSHHLVFLGNPGTGKTTVARIIARVYGELGLLSKGHLVEVDRSGLVANFIGQTATKTAAVVEKAMGGVLFIDEAYMLNGNAPNDFGHEAVATLIKAMEDNRSDLVVIAAGYTDQMDAFLDINPGIRSRIGRNIHFADYSPPEMALIFAGMAAQGGYTLADDAGPVIARACEQLWDIRTKDFANARNVRKLFERVVEAQANRLCPADSPTEAELRAITLADLDAAMPQPTAGGLMARS